MLLCHILTPTTQYTQSLMYCTVHTAHYALMTQIPSQILTQTHIPLRLIFLAAFLLSINAQHSSHALSGARAAWTV
jgi:hypothetical protein